MSTEKDFNTPPYFDDFDEEKNFHRVLYRPTTALQARELTQSQTILQNQIERFGNHVFKDGSIVEGVAITYYSNTHYLSLADSFNTNTESLVSDYDNTYLITNSTNSNNAVRATIKIAKDGVATSYPATNRIYFNYISTGTDGLGADVNIFEPGDTLYFYSPVQNKLGTLDANNLVDSINSLASNGSFTSNGVAYCVGVSDGIIFQKGFFVRVDPQIITVSDYSTNVVNYVVGFNTTETIVTESIDESLSDNALGYSNENAPGAHRLKLTPTLVAKLKTDSANNTQFFAIVEFDGQEPTEQKDDPVYSAIENHVAKRTYEESGDYVIKPFQIETRVNDANTQSFYYEVSPGIAYVRGHRIEKVGTTKVEAPRAITTDIAQNQIVTANYGNYVKCDEFLGAFDTETLTEVSLYDTAQNALSEYEGVASAPSGSVVGTANIRAVVFDNGTKGTPSATFFVYLFNIQMNSGKSFSSDVKSMYTNGTFGKVKADLVLEDDLAVLKESNKNSLIFDTGISAIKRLTNNTGIGDTSYVFSQIKSATIAANGATTVTLDTAAPGATSEKLNATTGSTLTGSLLEDYTVYLSANAYSANLTGTLALSSGNVSITGTGTSFDSDFTSNSIIYIHANSTQTYVRRVASISNSTVLSIDSPISVTNALCNFAQYFVGGTPLPIESVYINSNTSFTANLGMSLGSGTQTVYCSYPVLRNQASAIPKIINKSVYVKIDCSNNAGNTVGPWNLGLTDVHKLKRIYIGTTYANTNPNRISWFNLDHGQREDVYGHASLSLKPAYVSEFTANTKMLVELDLFTANTDGAVGFFSVESYPIDDANTSNTNAIQSLELPSILRNTIDFRPQRIATANLATDIADATINPELANSSFDTATSGQYLIIPDNNFTADFEYYLPRKDLITIDPTGTINVNKGVPGIKPRTPFVENDQSVLAEAYVPPYPTPTRREYEQYKNDTHVLINLKANRRYTMKDIGVIEERVKRIEYYTVLNLLEQQARDVSIPDTNGLDRFKNGIFADPFNSHSIGNVADFEYKIAIDQKETIARPYFDKHDIDFMFVSSNSTNVQQTGPIVTLPYTHESYISQRFATKIRNTTESVWQWNGLISLYPSSDFYREENTAPNVNVVIDNAAPWEQFAASPFGTMYGDWRDSGSTSTTERVIDRSLDIATEGADFRLVANHDTNQWDISTSQADLDAGQEFLAIGNARAATITDTTTTVSTQSQTVNQMAVNVMTQNFDLGSFVKDVTIQPYMRSRLVAFVAYNMKPNTTLHAFFDDVNVDAHCAPGALSGLSSVEAGMEDRFVRQTAAYGTELVSDSTGFVCGIFKIPERTFRTGDRVFQLTNVDDLVIGVDAKITASKATFTADNVSVTKGSVSITVRQPEVSFTQTTNSRTNTTVTEDVIDGYWDPIAQSFSITGVPDNATGVFVSKIGVYFQTKDENLGCSLYICDMTSNMPDQNRIIGKAYLASADIDTSTDGTTETQFILDYPVYLLTNNDYAFIVQPDGNSPEYNIWVGETGGFDVSTNEQVFSNPYVGIMFISANRKTWTSIQKEDLKFNIYRSRFNPLSGTAVFKNEDDEYLTIDGFTRANSVVGLNVGDLVYTVNSAANTANTANLISHVLTSGVYGRIQYMNELGGKMWIDSSTANSTTSFSNSTNPIVAVFRSPDSTNTSYINANTLIAFGNVLSVDNLKYHAVAPKFGTLQPSRTNITYSFKGTTTSNITDVTGVNVDNNIEHEYNEYERHAMSKSNEIADLSSAKSSIFNVTLTTESDFVSPVINLSKKGMLFIENLINNDTTNEHTRYGNAISKYVSKRVVLADGQEAEDLKVYLTAYRPSETDIKIYAKLWNNEDSEFFNDKSWTELQYDNDGDFVYSSPVNYRDYIEYEFSVPAYDANTINSVPMGAFANVNVTTENPLTGSISIANNSNIITGTGTSFNTELEVGDRIRVVSSDYFAIRTVTNITNATSLAVDNGLQATNASSLYYVFGDVGNDGIVEYYNSANSRFIGFKEFAIKIVLLSSNPVKVPRLNDVRCVALQV